tara:strand:+ start:677 stop:1264 length:588 start_codon:yes stop_codon:yes gene_type:complete
MSLLSTASIWNNDQTKKRTPSINRHTMKVRNNEDLALPTPFENSQKKSEENSAKIKDLIASLSSHDDGDKLANFEPIGRPEINKKTDEYDFEPEHVLPQTVEKQSSEFGSNNLNLDKLSSYNNIYNIKNQPQVPVNISSGDSKMMEKVNYMIHLLEQQQVEKVDNVTEEFVLYVLLGVFVIFTVDSFTRIGKYVR